MVDGGLCNLSSACSCFNWLLVGFFVLTWLVRPRVRVYQYGFCKWTSYTVGSWNGLEWPCSSVQDCDAVSWFVKLLRYQWSMQRQAKPISQTHKTVNDKDQKQVTGYVNSTSNEMFRLPVKSACITFTGPHQIAPASYFPVAKDGWTRLYCSSAVPFLWVYKHSEWLCCYSHWLSQRRLHASQRDGGPKIFASNKWRVSRSWFSICDIDVKNVQI